MTDQFHVEFDGVPVRPVFNRLGGSAGAKRLLQGRTSVVPSMSLYPLVAMVTLGHYSSTAEYEARIRAMGGNITAECRKYCLPHTTVFNIALHSYLLAKVTPKALGLKTDFVTYEEVEKAARELGFHPCLREAALALRIALFSQPSSERLYVASRKFVEVDGEYLYCVSNGAEPLSLGMSQLLPNGKPRMFAAEAQFVFAHASPTVTHG